MYPSELSLLELEDSTGYVSVSWCCCHKAPQTGWLKITGSYSLQPEPELEVSTGPVLTDGLGEGTPSPLPAASGGQQSLVSLAVAASTQPLPPPSHGLLPLQLSVPEPPYPLL